MGVAELIERLERAADGMDADELEMKIAPKAYGLTAEDLRQAASALKARASSAGPKRD